MKTEQPATSANTFKSVKEVETGAKGRMEKMTPEQRSEVARAAVRAGWSRTKEHA